MYWIKIAILSFHAAVASTCVVIAFVVHSVGRVCYQRGVTAPRPRNIHAIAMNYCDSRRNKKLFYGHVPYPYIIVFLNCYLVLNVPWIQYLLFLDELSSIIDLV